MIILASRLWGWWSLLFVIRLAEGVLVRALFVTPYYFNKAKWAIPSDHSSIVVGVLFSFKTNSYLALSRCLSRPFWSLTKSRRGWFARMVTVMPSSPFLNSLGESKVLWYILSSLPWARWFKSDALLLFEKSFSQSMRQLNFYLKLQSRNLQPHS